MISKLEKLKLMLSEMIEIEEVKVEMASTTSDEGIVLFYDELTEGQRIITKDEEGNDKELEDGTYTISTDVEKTIIVVENSIIKSVEVIKIEQEPEVSEEEPEVTETEVVAEEEVENPTNTEEETDTDAIVELRKEVNELYSIVNELKKELEELKTKPVTESVEQEFENIQLKNVKGAGRYTQYIKRN